MAGVLELDPLFGVSTGDKDVWARQITAAAKKAKKVPATDLEEAITGIRLTDTMENHSSTIVLSLFDEEWRLIDSGFFDHNEDGKLDAIDVNYPDGSRYWWRMTQASIDISGVIELTFMERVAVQLMLKDKRKKVSRGRRTRAQFIGGLVEELNRGKRLYPGVKFHCKELKVRQDIKRKTKQERNSERDEDKDRGVAVTETELKIQRQPITKLQRDNVNEAMDAVVDLKGATDDALLGMLIAGIGESNFDHRKENPTSRAHGVFQLLPEWWDRIGKEDTAAQARYFMESGYYKYGSAIEMAKNGVPPEEIAWKAEGSDKGSEYYGLFIKEAEALLSAYGGGLLGSGGGGRSYNKQYAYSVNRGESYWEAAVRLALEVNWAFFVDGQHVYYEDENILIQQMPKAVIHRDAGYIVGLRGTWDARHLCTEIEMDMVCDPFEFRAGQVLKLQGFGPLSSGSSARPRPLPGRWLIAEIQSDRFQFFSTFKLKQPEREKKEPRPETGSTTAAGDAADVNSGMTPKKIIDEVVIPVANEILGTDYTPEKIKAANDAHNLNVAGSTRKSWHKGDGFDTWAADLFDKRGSQHPDRTKDQLAKRLTKMFDLPPLDYSLSGPTAQQSSSGTYRGFQVQLIYRSQTGGNHDNHIHIGFKDPTPNYHDPGDFVTPQPGDYQGVGPRDDPGSYLP